MKARAEGTYHPGSGSDPNLLKSDRKIALKEQLSMPKFCQVWREGDLVSRRRGIPLSDSWGGVGDGSETYTLQVTPG